MLTEQWAIAIVMCFIGLGLKLLSSIMHELREMRKDLEKYVTIRECESDMDNHCKQLNDLFANVNKVNKELAEMKSKIEVYHSHCVK